MTKQELDDKIERAYKNWSVDQVAKMVHKEPKYVRKILKERDIEIRKIGHNYR